MDTAQHVSFFLRHLRMLPSPYQSADNQRMTLGYFCLSALDLLGAVETKIKDDERRDLIDWVYEQQLSSKRLGGFRGAPLYGDQKKQNSNDDTVLTGSGGHLAMSYTALLILGILRDDFSRLDRVGIRSLLKHSQQSDGSFRAGPDQVECDVRFSFCAFAIAFMCNAWDAIDVEAGVRFVLQCRTFDGAFAQQPNQEAHGGSTYCAVSALHLAGRLKSLDHLAVLQRWLLARQQPQSGFNGRLEKPTDTCYSFWCGASLKLINAHHFVDAEADSNWIHSTQSKIGGFAKIPGENPDAMHSYMGVAALSMHRTPPLLDLSPAWNCSELTRSWITDRLDSQAPK